MREKCEDSRASLEDKISCSSSNETSVTDSTDIENTTIHSNRKILSVINKVLICTLVIIFFITIYQIVKAQKVENEYNALTNEINEKSQNYDKLVENIQTLKVSSQNLVTTDDNPVFEHGLYKMLVDIDLDAVESINDEYDKVAINVLSFNGEKKTSSNACVIIVSKKSFDQFISYSGEYLLVLTKLADLEKYPNINVFEIEAGDRK